jgi:hypothetical protein
MQGRTPSFSKKEVKKNPNLAWGPKSTRKNIGAIFRAVVAMIV